MSEPRQLVTAGRYQELDALRGIAALMVVFFHFTRGKPEYNTLFKFGTTGVDLFFIISGFVIFMTINRISKSSEFIISRVSRLYPTYWASVTFTFIMLSAYSLVKGTFIFPRDILVYLGNLTMFQYYLGLPDLDGPYWTMIIEMLFYISILFLWMGGGLKYLNTIGIILCVVVTIAAQFFYQVQIVRQLLHWFPLFQFIPLFFSGTVFYKIYKGDKKLLLNYSILTLCLICQTLLFNVAGRSKYFIEFYQYGVMLILFYTLFVLFVNNRLKFVVNKYTLFLGKISFALYLTHQALSINFILPLFIGKLGMNFWIVSFLIALPIIIAVAAAITYLIEIPLGKRMKNKLNKLAGNK